MNPRTTRLLLALSRWARANGWRYALDDNAWNWHRQDVREWRRGDIKVSVLIHTPPFPPSVSVYRWLYEDRHEQIVHVADSADVDLVARVFVAAGLLAPDWRRPQAARPLKPTEQKAAQASLFDLMTTGARP